MALGSSDYSQLWSAQTAVELRMKSLAANLFDMTWSADWRGGESKVTIPIPDWVRNTTPNPDEGVGAVDRARGGDWADDAELDQDNVVLARLGGKSVANSIGWEDALEIPWDTVSRLRSRQEYEMRISVDKAIYDYARSSAGSTITLGAAGTDYISRVAPYNYAVSADTDHPVMIAIDTWALHATRQNAVDGEMSPTGSASRPFLIFQPELIKSLRSWLRRIGLHFDPLTQQLLAQNPGLAGTGYVGTLSGCDIFDWNYLAVPTGTDNWEAYAGIREAVAMAVRDPLVQVFNPQENQSDKPGWRMRQAIEYAAVEVFDNLHAKIVIHAD